MKIPAFGKLGKIKRFRNKYLALVTVSLVFLSFAVNAQTIDTISNRQPINGNGFSWKFVQGLYGFLPPRDTFHLAIRDTGSVAYKNGAFYQWSARSGVLRWDSLQAKGGSGSSGTDSASNANAGIIKTVVGTNRNFKWDSAWATANWLPNHPDSFNVDQSGPLRVGGVKHDSLYYIGGTGGSGPLVWVDNIDSVKAYRPANGTIYFTKEYNTGSGVSSGGGYQFVSASTATGNDMTVLTPSVGSGAGRWVLLANTDGTVNTYQVGIFGSGDNTTKLQTLINFCQANRLILNWMQIYAHSALAVSSYCNIQGITSDVSGSIALTNGTTQGTRFFYRDSAAGRASNITIEHMSLNGQESYQNGPSSYLGGGFASASINKDSGQNSIWLFGVDTFKINDVKFQNSQNGVFLQDASQGKITNWTTSEIGQSAIYNYYDRRTHDIEVAYFTGRRSGLFEQYDLGGPAHGANIAPRRNGQDLLSPGGYNWSIHDGKIYNDALTLWFWIEARWLKNAKMYNIETNGFGLSSMGISVGGYPDTGDYCDGLELYNIHSDSTYAAPFRSRDSTGGKLKYYSNFVEIGRPRNLKMHDNFFRNMTVSIRPFQNIDVHDNTFYADSIKDRATNSKYIFSLGGQDGATASDTSATANVYNNATVAGDAIPYNLGGGEVLKNVSINSKLITFLPTHHLGFIGEFFAPNNGRAHTGINITGDRYAGDPALYTGFYIYQNANGPAIPNYSFVGNDYTKTNLTKANIYQNIGGFTFSFLKQNNRYSDNSTDVNLSVNSVPFDDVTGNVVVSGGTQNLTPTRNSTTVTITPTAGTAAVLDSATLSTAGILTKDQYRLLLAKPRVFNPKDYGVVGDGITDNTTQYAVMMSAIQAAGGGVIHFDAGKYIGIIHTPAVSTRAGYLNITIEGDGYPCFFWGTVGTGGLPNRGTILKSNSTTSGLSVIMVDPTSGPDFSNVNVYLRNLEVRTYNNPSIGAVDLGWAAFAAGDNLFFNCDTLNVQNSHPTHTTTGFVTPRLNNGAMIEFNNLTVAGGYTYGIEVNEHFDCRGCNIASCDTALHFMNATHGAHFDRFGDYRNHVGMSFSGPQRFSIDQWAIEIPDSASQTDANNKWQIRYHDVYDPNNYGIGDARWVSVKGNVGFWHSLIKTGGTLINASEVGTSSGGGSQWTGTTDIYHATGNVGVGANSSSPSGVLEVHQNQTSPMGINVYNDLAGGFVRVRNDALNGNQFGIKGTGESPYNDLIPGISYNYTVSPQGYINFIDAYAPMKFVTNAVTRMTITEDGILNYVSGLGNIGNFSSSASANTTFTIGSAATFNNNFILKTGSANKWYIQNNATADRLRILNSDANSNAEVIAFDQNGQVQIPSVSGNSSLKVGGHELQSTSVDNNQWISNGYYDNSNWRARATGYTTILQSFFGDYLFRNGGTNAANTSLVPVNTVKLQYNGGFAFGSSLTTTHDDFTGASLWGDGTHVGFNLGSDATGDLYYRNSSGYFTRLGIGSTGNVLTVASGLPSWAAAGGSTPTLQQVLTAGSTLTGSNTIATGANTLTISTSTAATTPLLTSATSGIGLAASATTGTGITAYSASGLGLQSQSDGGVYSTSLKTYSASTNNVSLPILELVSFNGAGPSANGFGGHIDFSTMTTNAGTVPLSGSIKSWWSNATHASRTSQFDISGVDNTVTKRFMNIQATGIVRVNNDADTLAKLSDIRAVSGAATGVVASGDFQGQTATHNAVSFTTVSNGVLGVYAFYANVNVTAVSAGVLTTTVTYTDDTNTSRTKTFYNLGSTSGGITTTGDSDFGVMGQITCYPNTSITITTTLTVGTATYNHGATIIKLRDGIAL